MKNGLIGAVVICLLLINACGIDDMPDRVKREVARDEVIGIWADNSQTDKEQHPITLSLDASGRFTVTGATQLDGAGTWQLKLDKTLVMDYSNRPLSILTWYFSQDHSGNLIVIGGTGEVGSVVKLYRVD